MMNVRVQLAATMIVMLVVLTGRDSSAQDRGDRGSRDRGESRDRGGFGGGSPGGFGGSSMGGPQSDAFRQMMEERMRRGGDSGGRPSFGGGPPGGFGGGPPGGFGGGGFGGGSPWGGSSSGGSPWGGSSEDRSSRFSSMMDRNGNGKIDQEEIDQMPSFVRDMMRSRGVELKAGASIQDFQNTVRGGFSGESGDPNRGGSRDGRSSEPVLKPYRQKEQKRMTFELPPKYSELDTDLDGQLAFHEWLAARREDIDEFNNIDFDGDAFLTPQELLDYDSGAAGKNEQFLAAAQKDRLVIVSARPSGSSRGGSRDGSSSRDDRSRDGRSRDDRSSDGSEAESTAQRYFGMMDRNQNGQIDGEEWDQSRRLRPMFEQAGIRISEMRQDEFVRNYVRIAGQTSGR